MAEAPPGAAATALERGSAGPSVAGGFAEILTRQADACAMWLERIGPAGGDLEPVHQTRVSLRRLRSALAIFRPATDGPTTRALAASLGELAKALGLARDWDVFLAEGGARVVAAFPEDRALARLHAAGLQAREAAYAAVAAEYPPPERAALMARVRAVAEDDAWQGELTEAQRALLAEPLTVLAAEVLERRYKRMRRAGKGIAKLETPALHALRLRAKRLRYAAEFFAPLFDAADARRFIRRLARLQDGLGHLNDSVVAGDLMDRIAPPPVRGAARARAVGLVKGYVAGEAAAARKGLRREWKRLGRARPFWR